MIENKLTEFKREYVEDIKYAVVAFANTDGGTIYIGIDDDGSVRGVDKIDATLLRITNMIRDAIRPDVTMFVNVEVQSMEGKDIIALSIQRGTARPYYLTGKGVRPEGVYIRHGASSVPASETVILNLIKETSGDCYEEARSLNQQLSFKKTAAYFVKKKIEFGDAQMRTLGIIGQDGTYTNLGMLLSDQCVNTIKMAVFEGCKKTVFHDREELSGSLLDQMEKAYSFLDQYNRTRAEFEGLERIDTRDYPVEALREALLNAIVHRDYGISSSTLISIFDDRIEFLNIGGLVRGISFEDIMLGVSVLRNQHLANIFYRLKLIEAYGTGMLKINECYADYENKPKIEATNNAFKITLPNINYTKENTAVVDRKAERTVTPRMEICDVREEIIIRLLEKQETIVRKDVEELLDVSQPTAVLILREMVRNGILVKEGGGRNLRYRLNETKEHFL